MTMRCPLQAVLLLFALQQLIATDHINDHNDVNELQAESTVKPDPPALTDEEAAAQKQNYCSIYPTNLPCLYGCRRQHAKCGVTGINYTSTPPHIRDRIVTVANAMRSQLAQGANTTGFPPAANMHALSYDLECEFFAGCFLKGCSSRDNNVMIALDRSDLGSTGYGVISFNATLGTPLEKIVEDAFSGWQQSCMGPSGFHMSLERRAYVDKVLRDMQPNFANDFLQLFNWNTTSLGCAFYQRNLSSNLMYYQFYCVYKPAVRLGFTSQLYKTGNAASACNDTEQSPNLVYSALCGEIREAEADSFVPFVNLNVAPATRSPSTVICGVSILAHLYKTLNHWRD